VKNYHATLELDPHSGHWMADIEDHPVHTWGRSLGKVKQYAHEALACYLDVKVETVRGHLQFRQPQLPADVLQALDAADSARTESEQAAARASEAKAAAARALVRDAHLSLRDAAEVLGLSHQRVQQLLAAAST
jgi:DNA-directed RNA polymerase specialized sigma subunit